MGIAVLALPLVVHQRTCRYHGIAEPTIGAADASRRPGWDFYTGTLTASETLQKSFGVYRGDKMSHPPTTFLRRSAGRQWMRIDGFATPAQLMGYFRHTLASR